MDREILEQEITKIEESIDEYDEADTLVIYDSIDTITNAGYKSEAVEPLLQLLERHPTAYFGDPGAIVSFIEQFGGEYEDFLAASVKRTPTITTVWMVNRCINAGEHTEEWMDILKEIASREDVNKLIKESAQEFLGFQASR
ncbi:MAG: hypothetical protein HFI39_14395 [Lachnospiraceae bacterium]|nr:hypothetical protein [Lachnospiraceae bacterium]